MQVHQGRAGGSAKQGDEWHTPGWLLPIPDGQRQSQKHQRQAVERQMPHALHLVPNQVCGVVEKPIQRIETLDIPRQVHAKLLNQRDAVQPIGLQHREVLREGIAIIPAEKREWKGKND